MSEVFGTGQYRYTVSNDWAKLPPDGQWKEATAVGVDSKDQVYVFNRGAIPLMVFDREGNFLRSWGEGVFTRPHGIHVGPDDAIYLTDDGDHTVRKFTPEGKLLMTIGVPGKTPGYMSLKPFCRCCHTALAPNGDIYIADGYGNACIHKYSADGEHLLTWGSSGVDPGQFNIPHNITVDSDGWVYVADRENHRIQIFDRNGRYETQWNNLHRPAGLFMPRGTSPICVVGEAGAPLPINLRAPNLGARVNILDNKGNLLARIGGAFRGTKAGEFCAPHGVAMDSRGAIYVAEVSATAMSHDPEYKATGPIPSLSKLTPVA